VKEFTNVAVNQTLKVREPPRLTTGHQANAVGFQLNLIGVPGLVYLIEASTDLTNWTPTSTITNLSRTTPFTDPELTNYSGRFYRATELAGSPNAAP
jgi:hypothetical protein